MKSGAPKFLYIYLFLLPLVFCFDAGRAPFELPKFLLTVFAAGLLFLLWFVEQFRSGQIVIKYNKLLLFFAAFVAVNILSLMGSKDSFLSVWGSAATPADGLASLVSILALVFVVLQYAGSEIPLKKIIWVVSAGAVLILIHGALQYAGIKFSGFSAVNLDSGRAYSTLGLPGIFSVYMAVVSFLTAALFLGAEIKWQKTGLLILFFLFQWVLYLSGTRVPAALNLTAMFLFILYFSFQSVYRKRAALLGAAAVLAAVVSLGLMPSLVVKKTNQWSLNKGYESRIVVWKSGLNSWQENKWLGSGPETFPIQQKKYESAEANKYEYWVTTWSKAHNQLIQFLVTTGVLGLAAFLFYFLLSLRRTYQLLRQENSEEKTFALAFMASGIFIFLANLTAFNYIPTEVYFFLFPVLAGAGLLHDTKEIKISAARPAGKLIFVLLILFFIFLDYKTFSYFRSELQLQKANAEVQSGHTGPEILQLIEAPVSTFPDNAFLHCYKANVIFSLVVRESERLSPEKMAAIVGVIDESSQTCIDLATNRYEPYDVRGKIFLELFLKDIIKDGKKSEESYAKFRELAPNSPVSYYNMGLLQLKQRNISGFTENMNRAIALKEDYMPPYYQLVKFYVAEKNQEALSEVLTRLTATTFYSGEFVSWIKRIAAETAAYPEWAPKLNQLYSKYEYLTVIKE